jgi:general transcription factor 3C polypeptide 3 (transcription factor C subunit 4)
LLKRVPHDLTVLQEIRPVLVEGGELQFCAELFQAAFVHFQHTYPAGFMPVADGLPVPGGGFDALQILVLADLHNALGSPAAAIGVVRAGTRWLQGRGAQRFWDACEDDREFDLEGGHVVREGEPRPGAYQLDVNARHRLAIARIKNGDVDEGKVRLARALRR